jgi:D-arginine dehydrogenase
LTRETLAPLAEKPAKEPVAEPTAEPARQSAEQPDGHPQRPVARSLSRAAERALPARASVVIIGGGLAGMATAHALTGAGMNDVLVLEREATCGYHASGRNAALGRQLTEDDAVTALTVRGAAFLRHPPAGFSDTPLWTETGSVLLVDRAEELAHLCERATRWELAHQAASAAELVARWPVLEGVPMAGGVCFPGDGVIDVHALLQGFQRGARARGARVEVGCEVLDIRGAGGRPAPGAGTCTVITTRGEVVCDGVVLAAGAWVEGLGRKAGARPVHFAPIKRHLFITEAVPGLDREAPFVWHVGERALHESHEFYVRPERTGYLLSGCDEAEVAPCDAVPTTGAREALADKLGPLAPRLAELGIARGWACLRTFAPDRRPVIGWDADAPGLFWVAGLGGHGATGSAAVGQRAAALVLERLG